MHLTIYPDRIIGKQRPRFSSGHAYTPKKTHDAENFIREEFLKTGTEMIPKGVPVSLVIDVRRHCPKSCRPGPDVYRPDWDNISKLVCDALNGIAWHDDSQIVDCHVIKEARSYAVDRIMIEINALA